MKANAGELRGHVGTHLRQLLTSMGVVVKIMPGPCGTSSPVGESGACTAYLAGGDLNTLPKAVPTGIISRKVVILHFGELGREAEALPEEMAQSRRANAEAWQQAEAWWRPTLQGPRSAHSDALGRVVAHHISDTSTYPQTVPVQAANRARAAISALASSRCSRHRCHTAKYHNLRG